MKIATLNINSVNAHIDSLRGILDSLKPDVMFLQEIKCTADNFPFFELQALGYNAELLGQKSYNGVAVLSKYPLSVAAKNIPGFADENARYLECESRISGQDYTFASLYLPNGNPPYNAPDDKSKFEYKLKWIDAFTAHTEDLLTQKQNAILGGDFNIIMSPLDVYNYKEYDGGALYCPEVQNRLNYMLRSGWCDTFRALHKDSAGYTFWDYKGNAFANDLGMRIDYILSSPAMTDRLVSCVVDRTPRQKEKSSDHTVLIAEFKD